MIITFKITKLRTICDVNKIQYLIKNLNTNNGQTKIKMVFINLTGSKEKKILYKNPYIYFFFILSDGKIV